MKVFVAGFKAFFLLIVILIALTLSGFGIVVPVLGVGIVAELLKVVLSLFGTPVPANIDNIASALLFIVSWVAFTYYVYEEDKKTTTSATTQPAAVGATE
jgi:hypothetical protein